MHVEDGGFGSDQHVAARVVELERLSVDDDRQMSRDSMRESLDAAFGESSVHSHPQGVGGVEVETVAINGDEMDIHESVGRDNVASPISCSERPSHENVQRHVHPLGANASLEVIRP